MSLRLSVDQGSRADGGSSFTPPTPSTFPPPLLPALCPPTHFPFVFKMFASPDEQRAKLFLRFRLSTFCSLCFLFFFLYFFFLVLHSATISLSAWQALSRGKQKGGCSEEVRRHTSFSARSMKKPLWQQQRHTQASRGQSEKERGVGGEELLET